jgi:hypothetical protein
MVSSGILRDISGSLIPSDAWMNEGDRRRIHSVIVGGSGRTLVDSATGEHIGEVDRRGEVHGRLFTGTHDSIVHAADDSHVYLMTGSRSSQKNVVLPGSRGRGTGVSRRLAWALAALNGHNPRRWRLEGEVLRTWGGADYNRLLAVLMKAAGLVSSPVSDAFSIRGVHSGGLSVQRARSLAVAAQENGTKNVTRYSGFREQTPYFKSLGSDLQRKEQWRAVPWRGFMEWIDECDEGSDMDLLDWV